MKGCLKRIRNANRTTVIFLAVTLVCAAGLTVFLNFYFEAFKNPYMMREIFDLSDNWQYRAEDTDTISQCNLRTGPSLHGGETLTLYKILNIELPEAAILIRANHQDVNVYLDETHLSIYPEYEPEQNPGMALLFISLPDGYLHKTLKIEITSPYDLYSGRTGPIMLGTVPTLEAYALSRSMRSIIFMAMCLLMGLCTIVLSFIHGLNGSVYRQYLAIGFFAVIWALYYICTEYIVFQFFTPIQMSVLSLGLYFAFSVPLTLFFYFSFERYKKWMLPAVIAHGGFTAAAFALQIIGIVDLPQLVNINNIFLAGLIYTVVLSVMEAVKKNRLMMLTAPFLTIAYGSMLYNFYVFYTRAGTVPYSYRDTYFLLILSVLVYNVWQFFSKAFQRKRENDVLTLQNRLSEESYEQIKAHLKEVGGLKHELQKHLDAIQMYLMDGQYGEAQRYLSQFAKQAGVITEIVYHDNYLINAVVGNLHQRAKEHGIKVDLKLKATLVNVADPDLYSLLSNILDNALKACIAVPAGKERFIRLTLSRREPYLNISCENSKTGNVIISDGMVQPASADGNHGYGLWIIERIVDAYNGIMNISCGDNTFTITAALKDQS